MDRKRVAEEVIEILCNKLPQLPLPSEDPDYDYDAQRLVPDITENELDIAEITMDLEDAFDIAFTDVQPGDADLKTIANVIDCIQAMVNE
ncbi:MAG: hypothetical protein ACYTF0_05020 [Planctomycetota bacterium]|jgi:acyl carrier protein